MIVQLILNIIFSFVSFLFSLLPAIAEVPNWINSAIDWIGWGLCFFPVDVWTVAIANIVAWVVFNQLWGVIYWLYCKIPGVN